MKKENWRYQENKHKLKAYFVLLGTFFSFLSCKKYEPNVPTTNVNFPAAYVVNGGDNTISVIDLRDNTVKFTIALNQSSLIPNLNWPHHIYLSPDGTTLAISVPGHDLSKGHTFSEVESISGAVVLMDSQTGKILSYVETVHMNHNALFSPDGSEVLTGMLTHVSPAIYIYDKNLNPKDTITAIETDPIEITYSANGKYLFIPAGEGRFVQVFDAKSKQNVKDIKVDLAPEAAWPGSDGNMYVTSNVSQSVNVINVDSLQGVDAIDLGFPPAYARYNANSQELWVSHSTGNEVVVFKKTPKAWLKTNTITVGNDAHAVVFTKNEKTALISNQIDGTVSVINVATKTVIKTIPVGNKPNGVVIRE